MEFIRKKRKIYYSSFEKKHGLRYLSGEFYRFLQQQENSRNGRYLQF